MDSTPHPAAYTDVAGLAARLGVTTATVRQHIAAGVPWLPAPTKLAGRWVWLTADLEGIEERRRLPGNPNWRANPAPELPVTDPGSATTPDPVGWWDDEASDTTGQPTT